MEYMVKIPETFLVHIAATGKMGSGELLELIRIWAQKECNRIGIEHKVKDAQMQNIKELRERLKNTIGQDLMDELDQSIKNTLKKLTT